MSEEAYKALSRAMKVCPECGRDMRGVDILAHIENHWPAHAKIDDDPKAVEAVRRRAILRDMHRDGEQ